MAMLVITRWYHEMDWTKNMWKFFHWGLSKNVVHQKTHWHCDRNNLEWCPIVDPTWHLDYTPILVASGLWQRWSSSLCILLSDILSVSGRYMKVPYFYTWTITKKLGWPVLTVRTDAARVSTWSLSHKQTPQGSMDKGGVFPSLPKQTLALETTWEEGTTEAWASQFVARRGPLHFQTFPIPWAVLLDSPSTLCCANLTGCFEK